MAKTRTSSAIELLLTLRRDDSQPLHRQLEQELRDAVRDGRLGPASTLPSTRALAQQLGVSRGIVVEAYEQLIAEGYLASRPGGTTHVARAVMPTTDRVARATRARFDIDFRPGRPDLDGFPRASWLRSVRRVLEMVPSERLGYLDGRGTPELREALGAYLNRARGTAAHPEDIVVSSGFAQGLRLVADTLRASGTRRVAMEDPSQSDARGILAATGLEVVGIPVDGSGIRVDLLEATDVEAVLVTAAHQYPTGAVLPADRRAALVAWANRKGALIVEDDYDAEFRYDREPIGAIQGLCADVVVYAGSASKILAPGLRLGWLVAPAALVDRIAAAKRSADLGSPALEQLAFADFLARGELDHHLRRMRPLYRRRRDALLGALDRHLPQLRPTGASAGLHVLAWLPPDLDESALIRAAAEADIGIDGVAELRIDPRRPGGLVFGYGQLPESRIDEGIRRLASVADAIRHTAA